MGFSTFVSGGLLFAAPDRAVTYTPPAMPGGVDTPSEPRGWLESSLWTSKKPI